MSQKVAVVTGAASGIGLAVAEALSAGGYQLVMADVNAESGQREADRLNAYFVHADLTDRAACKALIDAAVAKFGSVDVLINNAGIQHVSPVEDFPEDKWDFIIRLMRTAPGRRTK
jgi:3-hydroxybutyrate dehydrogenase